MEHEPTHPEEQRVPQLIDTEIQLRDKPVKAHFTAGASQETIAAATVNLERLAPIYGRILRAYLSVPGVDAADPKLEASLHHAFAGSYADRTDYLESLSPLLEWQGVLDQTITIFKIPGSYVVDSTATFEQMREKYDVVELDGEVIAFHKR